MFVDGHICVGAEPFIDDALLASPSGKDVELHVIQNDGNNFSGFN